MLLFKRCIAMVLLTSAIFPQTTGSITGQTIHLQTGEPIGFVQIIVSETTMGTVSDVLGNFELTGLVPGTYELRASHIGFDLFHTSVEVVHGQSQDLSILLTEQAISVEEILVSAAGSYGMKSRIHSKELSEKAPRDVGDFFKTIAGGAAVKKGGYAQDPSLRGFQKDQLNIQFDGGIKIWGGCPNRMDPPTSHIQADDLEKIEVIKGPFSVRWGQTLGGIVNLVMKKPTLSETFQINGSATAGYESNGDNVRSRLMFNGGTKQWDFYLSGGVKSFHDYATGVDSVIIPSDYGIKDLSAKLAYNFSADSRIQISLRQARVTDVDFPALPMDAREDGSDIYSVDYSLRHISPLITSINTKLYTSEVKHIMDNLNRSNAALTESVTDADTKTQGGRFELGLRPLVGQTLYLGVDYYDHNKQGYRERLVKKNTCTGLVMDPPKAFVDSVWQDASIQDLGSFAELRHFINPKLSYTVGFRVDKVTATLGEPAANFIRAYGENDNWDEVNYSGMGILRYSPSHLLDLTLAAGRGTRSADITERFINHLPVGASPHEHFGNPELKAEVNNQLELGLSTWYKTHQLTSNVFISNLDNYIFARVDSSVGRVFMACQDPKVSKVFQNLDHARQVGFEVMLEGNLISELSYEFSVAYISGENLEDSTPLPEIPPFEAALNLRYHLKQLPLWLQFDGRWVSAQDRVSLEYGETATDGFNVYNLKSGLTLLSSFQINLAVNNIMNTAYFEHLSRNFAKNTADNGLPLYEPGRNVILNVSYKF